MSYDFIADEDKKLMYSLYMKKKCTYKGIAALFEEKYSNINENIVGNIIREKTENADPVIDFNSELKVVMQKVKVDVQANRSND